MDVVSSVNGVPIRLTDERWEHIIIGHPDLQLSRESVLDVLTRPEHVCAGTDGELIAVRRLGGRWMAVVYRELSADDGFIITAFAPDRDPALRLSVVWIAAS